LGKCCKPSAFIFCKWNFQLFIPEADAAAEGIAYLKILSASQLSCVWKLTSAGAFRGIGKTGFPSAISIGFNVLRIPLALLLAHTLLLGLNGIWVGTYDHMGVTRNHYSHRISDYWQISRCIKTQV
jgi:Na+-driven multidrug efflux pump